jgi:hypothetical protein
MFSAEYKLFCGLSTDMISTLSNKNAETFEVNIRTMHTVLLSNKCTKMKLHSISFEVCDGLIPLSKEFCQLSLRFIDSDELKYARVYNPSRRRSFQVHSDL